MITSAQSGRLHRCSISIAENGGGDDEDALVPGYEVSGGGAATRRHGSPVSVGAFLAVLAAVVALTVLSCVVGRACAARAEGPDERYDCAGLAGRRWWRWRREPRRPIRPTPAEEEVKQPAALPLPEP